jgi:hypothetical protein
LENLDIIGEVLDIGKETSSIYGWVVGRAILTMLIGVPNEEITENGKQRP